MIAFICITLKQHKTFQHKIMPAMQNFSMFAMMGTNPALRSVYQ
jgi:hypothetical protein